MNTPLTGGMLFEQRYRTFSRVLSVASYYQTSYWMSFNIFLLTIIKEVARANPNLGMQRIFTLHTKTHFRKLENFYNIESLQNVVIKRVKHFFFRQPWVWYLYGLSKTILIYPPSLNVRYDTGFWLRASILLKFCYYFKWFLIHQNVFVLGFFVTPKVLFTVTFVI